MRISVVVPCFNNADSVKRALESISLQTFPAHEIILIDDGSTDGSPEQVASSAVSLRLLRTRRANAAGARNAGIEVATGDWVAFLDADCFWYPHHLEWARTLLSSGSDVALMSYAGVLEHSSAAPAHRVKAPLDSPTTGLTHDAIIKWRLSGGYGFPTNGMVLEKDALIASGGFDTDQVRRHDFELFLRLVHGRSWSFHPGPTWYAGLSRPGDLSFDRAKTRYFAARALLKNEGRYGSPALSSLIRREARRALADAIENDDADDIHRARGLIWHRLSRIDRLIFNIALSGPTIARSSLRRIRARNQPATSLPRSAGPAMSARLRLKQWLPGLHRLLRPVYWNAVRPAIRPWLERQLEKSFREFEADSVKMLRLGLGGAQRVSSRLSPRDRYAGPSAANAIHYARTGLSALGCINQVIESAGARTPTRILDFPCGHGRVLRVLRAAFPKAITHACDIDREMVNFCSRTLGATGVHAPISPKEIVLDTSFDLIWCGSLLTHFSLDRWGDFLDFFVEHLRPGGLLVVTTHGESVFHALARGERSYGLSRSSVARLVAAYRDHGTAFSPYPWDSGAYGIALAAKHAVLRHLARWPALELVSHLDMGWDRHQDVFGWRRR